MTWQTTLGRSFTVSGIGVHTGVSCTLTAQPAPAGTGLRFQRSDLPGQPIIAAAAASVDGSGRCTRICDGRASVSTIEHLLAALRGMEIDNCLMMVDGPETPILDGSAACFVREIQAAGVVGLDEPRQEIRLTRPVWVSSAGRHMVALPCPEFRISFTFTNDKGHVALTDQYAEFAITPEIFAAEIAPARTMGWLAEIETLRRQGLIKGGSAEVAVVVGEKEIITPLRYADELVRHKILDVVGDMAMLGHLQAHIIAIRSGHQLNAQLAAGIRAAVAENQPDRELLTTRV